MKNVNEVPKITDTRGKPKTKRETEQYDPYKKGKSMSDVKFFPKLLSAKRKELWVLHSAIDFLIETTPVDQNPMTNDGYNSWKWGLIKVDGKEFPAPYKKVGYN
jgi:hypothetical protein